MKVLTFATSQLDRRRAFIGLMVSAVLLIALGVLQLGISERFLAYLLILLVSALPGALWLWAGAPGVPILPAVSIFYFLYFGVPILRNHFILNYYSPYEILRAGSTVALFLIVAVVSWRLLLLYRVSKARTAHQVYVSGSRYELIIFLGLDRKSTRLNSSHIQKSRMPSSA